MLCGERKTTKHKQSWKDFLGIGRMSKSWLCLFCTHFLRGKRKTHTHTQPNKQTNKQLKKHTNKIHRKSWDNPEDKVVYSFSCFLFDAHVRLNGLIIALNKNAFEGALEVARNLFEPPRGSRKAPRLPAPASLHRPLAPHMHVVLGLRGLPGISLQLCGNAVLLAASQCNASVLKK